ncbi:hypothetical protein L1887_50298 [Cichorium endivia]|nr:hypothetical protein L1887_50298 [Cichorium endivia]
MVLWVRRPLDVEARYAWFGDKNGASDFGEVDYFRWIFAQLFGLVGIVDVVSDADELLVAIRRCEQNHRDTQQMCAVEEETDWARLFVLHQVFGSLGHASQKAPDQQHTHRAATCVIDYWHQSQYTPAEFAAISAESAIRPRSTGETPRRGLPAVIGSTLPCSFVDVASFDASFARTPSGGGCDQLLRCWRSSFEGEGDGVSWRRHGAMPLMPFLASRTEPRHSQKIKRQPTVACRAFASCRAVSACLRRSWCKELEACASWTATGLQRALQLSSA